MWRPVRPLFPPLNSAAQEFLGRLPEILAEVWPLNKAHRASLPEDIAHLSRLLTAERGGLDIPYWSKPRFISAYLYYFLPWNLVRLCRLLEGLPLEAPKEEGSLLLDAGSGPLTLPLALRLARPQWQGINVLALDSSPRPLELGRKIFALAQERMAGTPWKTKTMVASLTGLGGALRKYQQGHRSARQEKVWLVTLANVLNEVLTKNKTRLAAFRREEESESFSAMLETILVSAPGLEQILFVEPGTRLGGTMIMRLREAALELGLTHSAPCTHDMACPLLSGHGRGKSYEESWCHFTFSAEGAPDWLVRLSRQAGLEKRSLSLSPLLLNADLRSTTRESRTLARVISKPFAIPARPGLCRYACAPAGLCLMTNAAAAPSGSEVVARVDPAGSTDARSGAKLVIPQS